ncbi:ORF1106 [White spot syndrome virus]|uniref:Wsv182 n=3 Tax=White spot syndrome virus TaxID=342409 RepID=Q8VB21_WSSVS|nr:wsv182 [Shrimp white spot syndrome virus]AFX59559.1 wsv182 [White spot syndrome virus]AAL33186.1 wsv182 [Shrimp white spot syndrome virus]AAL89106.1 WSSV238 [Shrimp white spot syndrome virus]ATU84078.1 ORF1106 [White spot syndrome virus]AWQ60358.1 wsv182 [Shrimp white spot syndrome virus]
MISSKVFVRALYLLFISSLNCCISVACFATLVARPSFLAVCSLFTITYNLPTTSTNTNIDLSNCVL